MSQQGSLKTHEELAAEILQGATAHDLTSLGLGSSAVEIDASMSASDATGQGGHHADLANRLIAGANFDEYGRRFDALIAANIAKRSVLEASERPPPVGPSCARGRAAIVDTPLHHDAIESDLRGHAKFGIVHFHVKHGCPARAEVDRIVSVQPTTLSFRNNLDDIAAAQAKDIAEGYTVVIGSVEECVKYVREACDCPGDAYMEEGTSAIDKCNQDEGGRREGVRVLHTAHEQNKATGKLPWCQCDGPMVGALKAVELQRTYEQRGVAPDRIVLLAEKRDWKAAYKHNTIAPCSLFMMGVRVVMLMCMTCGKRRTKHHDNECTCAADEPTTTKDTFGIYRASSFGTRASAFNFGLLGNAFKWMMHHTLQVPLHSLYVDDSYTVGVALRQDDGSISEVGVDIEHTLSWGSYAWSRLSARWGMKESPAKRIAGSSILNLGVVIDLHRMELRLTPGRLRDVRALLKTWLPRKAASQRDLQHLRGVLGWAATVVRGGYVVLSLFDAALRKYPGRTRYKKRVDDGVKRAVSWLDAVFSRHAGSRLILTERWIESAEIDLATDASGGDSGGYGGYHGLYYFAGQFPAGLTAKRTIAELELATVIVGVLAFGHRLRGRRIMVSCDNTNANSVARKGSANSSVLQYLAMALHMVADRFDIDLKIRWVSSKANKIADVASRDRATFIAMVNAFGIGKAQEVHVEPTLFEAIFAGYEGKWSWEWTATVPRGAAAV